MPPAPLKCSPSRLLLAVGLLLGCLPDAARAQLTGGGIVGSSSVGYIDGAIPMSQFRLRYDAADDVNRPNRAEFFWARGRPAGPGVPLPERSVNYQEASVYGEVATGDRVSAFFEVPTRFVNPEINANAAGLSDVNAGFKYAFVRRDDLVLSGQLRVFAPTGAASRGLGTHHASLEPAVLLFWSVTERLALEGELRYWIPVGGTDFAGDVLRYGTGLGYDLYRSDTVRLRSVTEVVGWTALGGRENAGLSAGQPLIAGAAGDTVVNAKVGLRLGVAGLGDVYVGYGRALTGERWYENTFRMEYRLGD